MNKPKSIIISLACSAAMVFGLTVTISPLLAGHADAAPRNLSYSQMLMNRLFNADTQPKPVETQAEVPPIVIETTTPVVPSPTPSPAPQPAAPAPQPIAPASASQPVTTADVSVVPDDKQEANDLNAARAQAITMSMPSVYASTSLSSKQTEQLNSLGLSALGGGLSLGLLALVTRRNGQVNV